MKLGNLYATWKIDLTMKENKKFREDVNAAIGLFLHNIWGDTCPEDATLNDYALETGDRIVAVYNTCKGKIWIISEFGRTSTTVLFPHEY